MREQHITLTDWMRILKGPGPWSFLLQVAFRVFFLYLLIIVSMRLIGKRMGPQLTRNEMAALVSLAAAVGIPMQSGTQGVLPALVVAAVVVGIARTIAWFSTRSQKFERLTLDDVDILVKDGCLQMKALRITGISRELVRAQLRSYGLDHMGKVRRLYLEANGVFTLQELDDPQPGLSLFPGYDREMIGRQRRIGDCFACEACGNLARGARPDGPCANCGAAGWSEAVLS
ncbi:MAG TPA: YetF domain-containing protein [Acetobacteraceae bacterium]|nr:YetF domain-containing protein [Acetobacteraceae bacterium]